MSHRYRWERRAGLVAAARRLGRDRGFAAMAVGVLALSVGAAGTIFAAVDAVLLRPLGYAHPERLLSVWDEHVERGWHQEYVAPANFLDWRARVAAFQDVAAYGDYSWDRVVDGSGGAELVAVGPVTGNLFSVLGVRPLLGRDLRYEETWSDSQPVVLLSHGFWQMRFGGDSAAVGRALELSGVAHEIVGVMPAGMRPLGPGHEMWVPFRWAPEQRSAPSFRRAHLVRAVARLAPGASVERAAEELRTVAAALAEEHPDTNAGLGAGVTPLGPYLNGGRAPALWAMAAAVSVLLLAGCMTLAYLVQVRWTVRVSELAIRSSLGAGRGDLMETVAFEGVWIAALGGTLGAVASLAGMRSLAVLVPPELLADTPLAASGRLAFFLTGATLAALALLVGLSARSAAGVPAVSTLVSAGRSASARRWRGARAFVTVQVALAVLLALGAGALARSFVGLSSRAPGFESTGVLTFSVPFPDRGDEHAEARAAAAERLVSSLRRLDRVRAAGAVRKLPATGNGWTSLFSVEGRGPAQVTFEIDHREADAGYFEALRVPVVAGRLANRDDEGRGVVVNETFARRAFPGEVALGRRITFRERPSERTRWWTIVGVVGDERQNGLAAEARPEVFTDYRFDTPGVFHFVVWSEEDPLALVPRVRALVGEIDAGLPVHAVATMDQVLAATLAEERFLALLAAAFAALALLLAVAGVYGVTAQLAAEWRSDLAVRMALGATPGGVLGTVLSRAAALVLTGLGFGALASLAAGRLWQAVLHETAANDVATLAVVGAVVALTGLCAALPAAARAMSTSPAEVLGS